jgi:hypothetical protein
MNGRQPLHVPDSLRRVHLPGPFVLPEMHASGMFVSKYDYEVESQFRGRGNGLSHDCFAFHMHSCKYIWRSSDYRGR